MADKTSVMETKQLMEVLSEAISDKRKKGMCKMREDLQKYEAQIKNENITQLIDLLEERAVGCLDEVGGTLLRMRHPDATYAFLLMYEPNPDKMEKFNLTPLFAYYPKVLEELLGKKIFERGALDGKLRFYPEIKDAYLPLTQEKWLEVKHSWLEGRNQYEIPLSDDEIEQITIDRSNILDAYSKQFQEADGM